MNYKASRDIPIAARDLRVVSPTKIIEWIREHRTQKDLNRIKQQACVTPQSISRWLKRHPNAAKELEQEQVNRELSRVAISESMFENGAFKEIPCVKDWIRDLTNKGAKPDVINGWINGLKRVCKGNIRTGVDIEDWGMKHPEKLTLEDAKNFIFEVKKSGYRSREWRLILRNFLTSKGMVIRQSDISGQLEEDAGKYSDLYVSKEKIHAIFAYLKRLNQTAFLSSKFGYKTASRLTATLEADAKYMNMDEHTIVVFEKSVKGKAKKKVVKQIPDDLWQELPKNGKLFSIEASELNKLLRAAYEEVIPDIEPRIPMPFHFWRHMFAQHMLRASNWNYALVASLGHWSLETLRRYYGQMPAEVIRQFGLKTLPELDLKE
jgi:integrase